MLLKLAIAACMSGAVYLYLDFLGRLGGAW
jgi:hypothetical protein